MSDVKALLEQATPLPWTEGSTSTDHWGQFRSVRGPDWVVADVRSPDPDAALIVYAVNRLPAYEAAVEALERVLDFIGAQDHEWQATTDARAALARLRDEVPA